MRIASIDLPETAIVDNGLGRILMDRLGSVVVLAGPNGSGKSRLLQKIRIACSGDASAGTCADPDYQVRIYQDDAGMHISAEKRQKGLEPELAKTENTPAPQEHTRGSRYVPGQVHCFDWVPRQLEMLDCNDLTKTNLVIASGTCKRPGFDGFNQSAFAGIQHEQNLWREATHPANQGQNHNATQDSYGRLCCLLKALLGTALERDREGNAIIFGHPLAKAGLSEGQRVLLQFAVGLHAQGASLSDTILLMDEPETHLHPSVIMDVIERVKEAIGDGQLWIATHSLPLVAQFEPEQIWYMEDGKVSYAGKTPENVLYGLLGGEERAHKLAAFTDLPASYAANRFAFECLLPPGTVPLREGDPQMPLVTGTIDLKGACRILDFGAGQGRLASSYFEKLGTAEKVAASGLDYVAYDANDRDRGACVAAISRLYGTAKNRWFDHLHELIIARRRGTFDAVVMCNVLHEIDPVEWPQLFSVDSPLVSLIAENGFLLIVEDQRMPMGEKAYAKGFLVLDTDEIRTLFDIKPEDIGFHFADARGDGRLKAHRIPRDCLSRLTPDTRLAALTQLRRRAKDKIRDLRKAEPNLPNGRLHAFWVQQLANATFALDELGGTAKP